MNSWVPNQNNNMVMGQAQFSPYSGFPVSNYNTYNRLPVYKADPIHGENAAWQFPMAPNSEIYLPDADEDLIWWIRTDANGMRDVQGFNVSLRKKPEPIDTNDLAARLAAVEEWINGKSNKSNAKRNATPNTTATTVTATVE